MKSFAISLAILALAACGDKTEPASQVQSAAKIAPLPIEVVRSTVSNAGEVTLLVHCTTVAPPARMGKRSTANYVDPNFPLWVMETLRSGAWCRDLVDLTVMTGSGQTFRFLEPMAMGQIKLKLSAEIMRDSPVTIYHKGPKGTTELTLAKAGPTQGMHIVGRKLPIDEYLSLTSPKK